MSAINVAQASGGVVIDGENQRRITAISGVLVKELVYRLQETLWLVKSNGALAAQVALQVGHQKRRANAFARSIADDESQAVAAKIQKVIVVAAHLARLNADAGVIQGTKRRQVLWKKP